MNAKLTLKMDDIVIASAKRFARTHHTSLSKLAETYFKTITREAAPQKKVSGVVGELAGLLKIRRLSQRVRVSTSIIWKKNINEER
ncbi:hypothetical protein GMJAKD_06505 [Candidatus Electrothrix aarhusensis]